MDSENPRQEGQSPSIASPQAAPSTPLPLVYVPPEMRYNAAPGAGTAMTWYQPAQAAWYQPAQVPVPVRPAQAGVVLGLGIASLFFHVLGPITWILANRELRAMDAGLVSADQRATVQGGKACAVISTLLMALSTLLMAGLFVTI